MFWSIVSSFVQNKKGNWQSWVSFSLENKASGGTLQLRACPQLLPWGEAAPSICPEKAGSCPNKELQHPQVEKQTRTDREESLTGGKVRAVLRKTIKEEQVMR